MQEITRQEAYVKSEEMCEDLKKEFDTLFKQNILPKIKVLQNFADKHHLVVSNPLYLCELDDAVNYMGVGFGEAEKIKNNNDVYFDGCENLEGRWFSSSEMC